MGRAVAKIPDAVAANEGVHEAELTSAIERLEELAEQFVFDPAEMIAKGRDHMVDLFKTRPKPWSQLSNGEQRDVAAGIENVVRGMVSQMIQAVALAGRPGIRAKFEGYADKSGDVKGSLKFFSVSDDDVLSLHRASGKVVLMVTADADEFDTPREADTDPDQPEMFAGPVEFPDDNSDLADTGDATELQTADD